MALIGVVAAANASGPQTGQGAPQPVTWSLALEPVSGRVAAGGTLRAVITARIDEGWHVYAPDEANSGPRPVHIAVAKSPVFTAAGTLDAPEPDREMDDTFGQITSSYSGKATFRLPVAVAQDAKAGVQVLELGITFQACDGRICLPARATRLKTSVEVTR